MQSSELKEVGLLERNGNLGIFMLCKFLGVSLSLSIIIIAPSLLLIELGGICNRQRVRGDKGSDVAVMRCGGLRRSCS